jgi:hypothetical protein
MSRPAKPLFLARASYRQRRIRDAARLLPILGSVLWLLPLLWTGDEQTRTSVVLVYVFAVWAFLIVASFILSRWIKPDPDETTEDE